MAPNCSCEARNNKEVGISQDYVHVANNKGKYRVEEAVKDKMHGDTVTTSGWNSKLV